MITISKIAKLANVSISTASKAFSMSGEVNEETRQMIFKIAEEQGCFKKFYNAKYPKYVIAVICPEFKSLHYSRSLAFIQQHLEKMNCEICVAATNFCAETEQSLLDYYYKYSKVDGIITISSRIHIAIGQEIPVVAISPMLEQKGVITIKNSSAAALTAAIDHFASRGVTDIAFIGESHTGKKRELFEQIMTDRCGTVDHRLISLSDDRFEKGGYDAAEKLLKNGCRPRAVICAYDYMALGAMRCFFDHGLSVPEDVAVIGMDDIPECAYLNPPLSSIDPKTEQVCKAAADAILTKLRGQSTADTIAFDSVLNLRRSSEI